MVLKKKQPKNSTKGKVKKVSRNENTHHEEKMTVAEPKEALFDFDGGVIDAKKRFPSISKISKYGIDIEFEDGRVGFLRRTNMISNMSHSTGKIYDSLYALLDGISESKIVNVPLNFPIAAIKECHDCNMLELSSKYDAVEAAVLGSTSNDNAEIISMLNNFRIESYPFALCSRCKSPLEVFSSSVKPKYFARKEYSFLRASGIGQEIYRIGILECGRFLYNQRVWISLMDTLGSQQEDRTFLSLKLPSKVKSSLVNIQSLKEGCDLIGRKIHGCEVLKINSDEQGRTQISLKCPGGMKGKATTLDKKEVEVETPSKKKMRKNDAAPTVTKESILDGVILDIDWLSQELTLNVDPEFLHNTPATDEDFIKCNKQISGVKGDGSPATLIGKINAVTDNFACVSVRIPCEESAETHAKVTKKKKVSSNEENKFFTIVVYTWYMNNKHYDVDNRVVSRERTRCENEGRTNPFAVPRIGDTVQLLITDLWSEQAPFYIGTFASESSDSITADEVIELDHANDVLSLPIQQTTNSHEEAHCTDTDEEHEHLEQGTTSATSEPKKLTNKAKEYIIDAIERSRRPQGLSQKLPETKLEYEKILLSSPLSSELWIRYIAFTLGSDQNDALNTEKHATPVAIENARRICERALGMINAENENDRWNIWVAYLTIEVNYGTAESIDALFRRFVRESEDQSKAHLALFSLYEEQIANQQAHSPSSVNYNTLAVELASRMLLRFRSNVDVWIRVGKFIITASVAGNDECVESLRHLILRSKKNSAENLSGLCVAFRSIVASALKTVDEDAIVQVLLPFSSFLYRCLVKASMKDFNTILSAGRAQFEYLLAFNPKKLTLIYGVYADQEIRVLRLLREGTEGSQSSISTAKKNSESQYVYVQNLFRRLISLPVKPRKMERLMGRFLTFEQDFGDEASQQEVEKCVQAYAAQHMAKKNA